MTMLVRFENDFDIQYHVFTECPDRIAFIFDPIFKYAVHNTGYSWSAIEFPDELAYKCGFTISKCEGC